VIAGVIIAGPLGLLVGPFIGAVAFELGTGRASRQAVRSGIGAALGLLVGRVTELAATIGLSAWFVVLVAGSLAFAG
jgi:uncharacterized protein YqgC (DUF456 family)